MKPRPLDPTPRLGSISRDEVLSLEEAGRRMGWAERMQADVQKMGLRTAVVGRRKYVTGAAVYRFIEHLATMAADAAEAQAKGNGDGGRGDE